MKLNLINYVEEKNVSSQAFSKFGEDISFVAWILLLEMCRAYRFNLKMLLGQFVKRIESLQSELF